MFPKSTDYQQQRQYDTHSHHLDHAIKSLEDQIELTVYNYENILQTEKKNSADRSEFLLYLIQSLRTRHNEEIQTITSQLQNAQGEREQAQTMQKQMENIGEGLDQIMEESRRLKLENENLEKLLEEQEVREKELDDEVLICQKQLDECRLKVDEWERVKMRWNRQKKQLLQMIEDAEKTTEQKPLILGNGKKCAQTGEEQANCEHCHKSKIIEQLWQKYNGQPRNSS